MIIDAHAHLAQSKRRIEELVAELRALGMEASIQGGVGPEDWDRQLELARLEPRLIRPVLGLHPWWVLEHTESQCREALADLEQRLSGGLSSGVRPVALGELGLDYFRDETRDASGLQKEVFEAQLQIAVRAGLPVVLHVVHAHEAALQILGQASRSPEGGGGFRGLVHAFSGSYEVARQYLALGLKLSIGPGIAQPGRFKQLKAALPRLSPSDWVLESDGEGPELFRAARAAAVLVGRSADEVLEQSGEGVRAVFQL